MKFLDPYEFTITNNTSVVQTEVSLLYPSYQIGGFTRQQASDTLRQSVTGQSWGVGIGTSLVVPHTLYQVPTNVKVFRASVDITSLFTVSNLTASSVTLTKTVADSVSNAIVKFYGNPPVSVSYNISGQTYLTMLYDILDNPSVIGAIHLQSASSLQVGKPWMVKQHNVRGKFETNVINPVLNPSQKIGTSLFAYPQFIINGWTELILSSLRASESLTIGLYPLEQYDRDSLILDWTLLERPDGDYNQLEDGVKFLK